MRNTLCGNAYKPFDCTSERQGAADYGQPKNVISGRPASRRAGRSVFRWQCENPHAEMS
jgi:hypothetical protein